ncbi:MAG: MATE family efflux transporter [Clostridiales bacterium]|nr:MATE family efflux transporter [Clostridiales bacterium]
MSIERKVMLRTLIALSIPACIDFMLQSALSYADYIMVGKLGSNASAAVGLTQEVNYLLRGVLMAAGIGVVSYISVSMGKRQYKDVKRASIQSFYMSAVMGLILLAVSFVSSPFLPEWMGADETIRADASSYFRIIYLPVVFISLNMILGSALKGVGDMKTPMYVNAFMNILNIALNFLLIYNSRTIAVAGLRLDVWGAGLGVKGSAMGTAIASVVGGVLMIIGVYRNPLVSPIGERFTVNMKIIKRCIVTAIPVLLCRITTSLGRVVFTAFITGLGTLTLAAHTITFTAESAFYMAVVGAQTAVTTLAGNYKGERNKQKLNQLTISSCALIASLMFVVGIIMIAVAKPVISFFTADADVIYIGTRLFYIIAVNEAIFGVSMVMEGIFNGTGDTKSPFIVSIATLWIVRVLGTWIVINVLGLGIYGAWICMVSENAVRGIALLIRYNFVKDNLIQPSNKLEAIENGKSIQWHS